MHFLRQSQNQREYLKILPQEIAHIIMCMCVNTIKNFHFIEIYDNEKAQIGKRIAWFNAGRYASQVQ